MLKESTQRRLIEPEKTLQGFLGLSIIFSGKHISFYILLRITVDRVSIYCLKGVTLQSKFLAWSLRPGSLGLIIRNARVKFPLNSFLRNGDTTYSMKPLWECALCKSYENGWSCEQVHALGDCCAQQGQGKAFCAPLVANSTEMYCGIQPQLYYFTRTTFSSAFSQIKSNGLLRKIREGCCALAQLQTICLKDDIIGNSVVQSKTPNMLCAWDH